MSATRMFRKLEARSGSEGGSSVTVGVSSVGPPPTLMVTQPFARATIESSPSRTRLAAKHLSVEASGALNVSGDDEVGECDPLRGRWKLCHLLAPSLVLDAQSCAG